MIFQDFRWSLPLLPVYLLYRVIVCPDLAGKLENIVVTLRHYTQSTKLPQPESRAEHTDYTRLFAHSRPSAPYVTTLPIPSFKIPKGGSNMDTKSDD